MKSVGKFFSKKKNIDWVLINLKFYSSKNREVNLNALDIYEMSKNLLKAVKCIQWKYVSS